MRETNSTKIGCAAMFWGFIILLIFFADKYHLNNSNSADNFYKCIAIADNGQEKGYCVEKYGYPAMYVCEKMVKKQVADEGKETALKRCQNFIKY